MCSIGIVGLGSMGQPMARRLARAGHPVIAWNRTPGRAEALHPEGVKIADSPAEAARADVLISMLSDDAALEEVVLPGGRPLGAAGLVHVSMSTVSDALATRLAAAHAAAGQAFVAAPVFGAPDAAQAGKLVIAAAGERSAVERVRPLLEVLGRVDQVGIDPASACVVKAAGNFLMAAVVESLRDSLTLVHAAGVDPRQFVGIVTQSLFPTPVYQFLGGTLAGKLVEGAPRVPNPFAKSAALSLASARRLGVALPVLERVAESGR
ncbi:MAG: NAD(P)-dependent oxidoreductase [Steroidobacteraceae bacterium]|nr:NAD(P)-dependent oxidoreductase [Steroidobacteraceae bacterium]